jgi:uncharacterized protein YjbI with pentapeptide repeats
VKPRLPPDYRYLHDIAENVGLRTESAKTLCRGMGIQIGYVDDEPVLSEADSKKFLAMLADQRRANAEAPEHSEHSASDKAPLTHEEDQARLASAGTCVKCKAIWARFSDDFCSQHSPKGWRKSNTKKEPMGFVVGREDPIPVGDFVHLQPLIRELTTDLEEMRRVCHVLGVVVAYVGGDPRVSRADESRIRDEFRLQGLLRPKTKKADDAPIPRADGRIPLRLPVIGNLDNLNFDNTYLERTTYLQPKSDQSFAGRSLVQSSFRNCHFEEIDFSGLNLSGADFSESHLFRCRFDRANLDGAKFDHSEIRAGSFRDAELKQASFRKSLSSADFAGANLTLAGFVGSVLKGSDFAKARLVHCDFSGADLRNASFLQAHIDGLLLHQARYEPGQLTGTSPKTVVESPWLRQHFNADGSEKIPYSDRIAAAAAAQSLQATTNRKVNHYECQICRKWHIGHGE